MLKIKKSGVKSKHYIEDKDLFILQYTLVDEDLTFTFFDYDEVKKATEVIESDNINNAILYSQDSNYYIRRICKFRLMNPEYELIYDTEETF